MSAQMQVAFSLTKISETLLINPNFLLAVDFGGYPIPKADGQVQRVAGRNIRFWLGPNEIKLNDKRADEFYDWFLSVTTPQEQGRIELPSGFSVPPGLKFK